MRYKYIAATLLLTFAAPVLADHASPPTSQNGPNSRAERIMKRLDTNGDGVIEPSEFRYPGDRIIKEADLNGDGAVTLDELHKHYDQAIANREGRMSRRDAKMQARMDQMFKAMDTNGDGKVTLQEANAYAFKRLDKNGDGVLELDELAPQHRHRHRPEGVAPPPTDQ